MAKFISIMPDGYINLDLVTDFYYDKDDDCTYINFLGGQYYSTFTGDCTPVILSRLNSEEN